MWDIELNKKNSANRSVFQDNYIEYQTKMKNIQYGRATRLSEKIFLSGKSLNAAINSCEIIAVYNALIHINKSKDENFPELIRYFSQKGIVAGGLFGTSPKAIEDYFRENDYKIKSLKGGSITMDRLKNIQKDNRTFIFTAYNKKHNPFSMIHTMCVTKEKNKYVLHNGTGRETYSDLAEVVVNYNKGLGETIYLLCIEKKG